LQLKGNRLSTINSKIAKLTNLKLLDVRENAQLTHVPKVVLRMRQRAALLTSLPHSMQQQYSFQLLTSLPDQITEHLFIADMVCSENLAALKRHKITHIANVAIGLPNHFPNEFQYCHLPMLDAAEEDLFFYIEKVCAM
jgi:hypothetical protein